MRTVSSFAFSSNLLSNLLNQCAFGVIFLVESCKRQFWLFPERKVMQNYSNIEMSGKNPIRNLLKTTKRRKTNAAKTLFNFRRLNGRRWRRVYIMTWKSMVQFASLVSVSPHAAHRNLFIRIVLMDFFSHDLRKSLKSLWIHCQSKCEAFEWTKVINPGKQAAVKTAGCSMKSPICLQEHSSQHDESVSKHAHAMRHNDQTERVKCGLIQVNTLCRLPPFDVGIWIKLRING